MKTKEIRNIIPKFKKGRLYLYSPVTRGWKTEDRIKKGKANVIVLSLCINKNYPTWLCLFPDGNTGGCYPQDLIDITLKND